MSFSIFYCNSLIYFLLFSSTISLTFSMRKFYNSYTQIVDPCSNWGLQLLPLFMVTLALKKMTYLSLMVQNVTYPGFRFLFSFLFLKIYLFINLCFNFIFFFIFSSLFFFLPFSYVRWQFTSWIKFKNSLVFSFFFVSQE